MATATLIWDGRTTVDGVTQTPDPIGTLKEGFSFDQFTGIYFDGDIDTFLPVGFLREHSYRIYIESNTRWSEPPDDKGGSTPQTIWGLKSVPVLAEPQRSEATFTYFKWETGTAPIDTPALDNLDEFNDGWTHNIDAGVPTLTAGQDAEQFTAQVTLLNGQFSSAGTVTSQATAMARTYYRWVVLNTKTVQDPATPTTDDLSMWSLTQPTAPTLTNDQQTRHLYTSVITTQGSMVVRATAPVRTAAQSQYAQAYYLSVTGSTAPATPTSATLSTWTTTEPSDTDTTSIWRVLVTRNYADDMAITPFTVTSPVRTDVAPFNAMTSRARNPAAIMASVGNRFWTDGSFLYTVSIPSDTLMVYNLSTGARDTTKEFSIDTSGDLGGANHPIVSDGTTLWIAVSTGAGPVFSHIGTLRAYTLATGARDTSKDINWSISNANSFRSLFIDGTSLWAYYDFYSGGSPTLREFSLTNYQQTGNTRVPPDLGAVGAGFDGTTIWLIRNTTGNYAQAYTFSNFARDASKDIPTLFPGVSLLGSNMTVVGNTAYVSGVTATSVRVFERPSSTGVFVDKTYPKDIALASGNQDPQGIWSNGATMWVVDGQDSRVYAYAVSTSTRDTTKEFTFTGIGAEGLWSNGTTMWIVEGSSNRAHAYTLATGARDSSKDLSGVFMEFGMWSDGTTAWFGASESGFKGQRAVTLDTNTHDSTKDFTVGDEFQFGDEQMGSWSDGVTMWIADRRDGFLHAYNLDTGVRDTTKEFDAGDISLRGVWSNRTTMWVSSQNGDSLRAYE